MGLDFNDPEQARLFAGMDKQYGPWRLTWIVDVNGRNATSLVTNEHGHPLPLVDTLRGVHGGGAALLAAGLLEVEPGDLVEINTPKGVQADPVLPPGKYRVTLGARSEQPDPDTGKALLITLFDKAPETLN